MGGREKLNVGEIRIEGTPTYVGSNLYQVMVRNLAGKIQIAATAISDPTAETGAGFAKGALIIKTNAADGTKAVYENQGTVNTASFNLGGAVDTADITASAVTSAKIASGAVVAGKIGTGAVTSAKVGTGAIVSAKVGSGAIVSSKIGTGAVVAGKIGSAAVISTKIKMTSKAVVVASGATSGTSAAGTYTGSFIVGVYPTSDLSGVGTSKVKAVSMEASGKAKVLMTAATATSAAFKVIVIAAS